MIIEFNTSHHSTAIRLQNVPWEELCKVHERINDFCTKNTFPYGMVEAYENDVTDWFIVILRHRPLTVDELDFFEQISNQLAGKS